MTGHHAVQQDLTCFELQVQCSVLLLANTSSTMEMLLWQQGCWVIFVVHSHEVYASHS